jgi:hypothetical protein
MEEKTWRKRNAHLYLSQPEIDEFKKAFSLFDKDGDGSISKEELACVMRSLNEKTTDKELQNMMDSVDVNRDGQIDFPEFLNMMGLIQGDEQKGECSPSVPGRRASLPPLPKTEESIRKKALRKLSQSTLSSSEKKKSRKTAAGKLRKLVSMEIDRVGPTGNLDRNMRTFRGVSRTAGCLSLIHRDSVFRLKLFGYDQMVNTVDDDAESGSRSHKAYVFFNSLVLLPSSRFKKGWDIIFLLIMFWITFRIPFSIAFEASDSSSTAYMIDFVLEFTFLFDMLFAFFTADIVDGNIVKDLDKIALRYLKGWLVIDILGAFPYSVVWSSSDVLKFLRLLRILKMGAMERRLVRSWDLNLAVQTQIKLYKLLFYIVTLLHVGACVWYYIAVIEGHGTFSWTTLYGVSVRVCSVDELGLAHVTSPCDTTM